jgi:hypothetical protein
MTSRTIKPMGIINVILEPKDNAHNDPPMSNLNAAVIPDLPRAEATKKNPAIRKKDPLAMRVF